MSEEKLSVIILQSKETEVTSLWNPLEGCANEWICLSDSGEKPDENVCLGTYSAHPHWEFQKVFPRIFHLPALNIELSSSFKVGQKLLQQFILHFAALQLKWNFSLFFCTLGYRVYPVTMAIHGFQKVNASIMCAASVVTTAIITQITFLPVLSTMKPRRGDAGAEMM